MRHEYGLWSMWRVDKSVRYLWKSRRHVRVASPEDAEHFAAVRGHLKSGSWRRPTAHPLTLAAVGDVMWIGNEVKDYIDGPVLERLRAADLRFANLETPIDRTRKLTRFDLYRYNSPPSLLAPWPQRTVLSLCNNHSLDFGVDGLVETRRAVLDAQHTAVGGDDEAHQLAFVRVRDVRIACIASTFGFNRPGSAKGLTVAPLGMRDFDWSPMQALIDEARANADLVVMQPHWGFEYEHWPERAQREAAYELIRRGVDVIFGSSPHVVQPLEIVSVDDYDPSAPTQIQRGGPPRAAVIAYSLGNFATTMATLWCKAGAVLTVQLAHDGRSLAGLDVLPTLSARAATNVASEHVHGMLGI